MTRFFGLIVAAILLAGFGQGTSVVSGLSQQGSFFYNANGTYAASVIPQWCVNAHTTTPAYEDVSLAQSVGATCVRIDASDWTVTEPATQGVYVYNQASGTHGAGAGTTTFTDSTANAFNSGMVGESIYINGQGAFSIAAFISSSQVTLNSALSTFSGATWTSAGSGAGGDPWWSAICAAGLTPVFVPTYNNALYAAGQFEPITSGSNAAGYNNFIVAVLNRMVATNGCSGSIFAEIFNEPNLTVWTTGVWTGPAYISVASGAASAIKAAHSGVTVLTGGASPGTGTTPAQLFLGGIVGSSPVLTNISGYGLHPYNYNEGAPANTIIPATQLEIDTQAFSGVAASGIGESTNKPIYITEYGFPLQAFGSAPTTCASPSTCQTQGYFMAYAMLTAIALQIPLFTEYDLVDDGTSYSATDQNTFGLFYNGSASSGNPVTGATPYGIKPQGTAFQSVTGCTSGTTGFNLSYNTTTNVETETFNKSGSNACLAVFTWDASTTKSFSQSIGTFSSVTCKDVLGNSYSCTYVAPTLTMNVTEAAGPVIVTATH